MLIRSRPGWEMPERDATPETVFEDRRRLAKALAAGPLLLGAAPALSLAANAAEAETDPRAALYPVTRNARYELDRAVTDERIVTTYNNFYEFGSHKQIWQAAQKLKTLLCDGNTAGRTAP